MPGDESLSSDRELREWPHWPDGRGWIAIAAFSLTVMVLWMVASDETLRKDEFFKVIATAIVLSGWGSVVAWGFAHTKTAGDKGEREGRMLQEAQDTIAHLPPSQMTGRRRIRTRDKLPQAGEEGEGEEQDQDPISVRVDQPKNDPIPIKETDGGKVDEDR